MVNFRSTLAFVASAAVIFGCAVAQAASVQDTSGMELNRTMEQLERLQKMQELQENKGKATAKVEGKQQASTTQQQSTMRFHLNKVETDASTVLTASEISTITAPYEGKEVTADDLYKIVAELNKLYVQKGAVTCLASLKPQTIRKGVVRITLTEGKTGAVTFEGNKNTKANYVKNRISLKEGVVADINKLNKDLLRFNATNDAQLRIALVPTKDKTKVDYVLKVVEPKQDNFTVLIDNAGNELSGYYREGLFYTCRSLSGERDALTLGFIRSQGMKAYSASYSRAVNTQGTKLNFYFSGNKVDSVFSPTFYHTEGRSNAFGIGLVHPLLTTEDTRSELTFDIQRQKSDSDFVRDDMGYRGNAVDDTLQDFILGYNLTKYGKDAIWYQKHNLMYGRSTSEASALGQDESKNYWIYKFNCLYQQMINKDNHLFTAKADFQHSFKKDLRSSRQFMIGGFYSVRGYKEAYLGGDSGVVVNLEYQVPLNEKRTLNAFGFFDYGRIYGENAESNNEDNTLYSAGLGLKALISKKVNVNLTAGFPLKKEFPGKKETVSSARVHFMVSGMF